MSNIFAAAPEDEFTTGGIIAIAVLSTLLALLIIYVVYSFIKRKQINNSELGKKILSVLSDRNQISVVELAKELNIEEAKLKRTLFQMQPIYVGKVLYKYFKIAGIVIRSVQKRDIPSAPINHIVELLDSTENGEYSENLPTGGKMIVTKTSWKIQYYFPGPDLRYNGTLFIIPGEEIDNYISAWKNNFAKYQELKSQMFGSSYSYDGEKGMRIRVNEMPDGVSLTNYHMPINTQEKLNKVLFDYETAKMRVQYIRDNSH